MQLTHIHTHTNTHGHMSTANAQTRNNSYIKFTKPKLSTHVYTNYTHPHIQCKYINCVYMYMGETNPCNNICITNIRMYTS